MNRTLSLSLVALMSLTQPVLALQINLDTPRTELTLKPGQSKRVRIKLINHEERAVRMKAYLQDVRILPDGSPEFTEPGTTPWTLKEFTLEAPAAFVLAGRSQRIVGLRITAPENAKGGRYGAMLFESEPVKSRVPQGGFANINLRLAALLLVDIKNTTIIKARITKLKAWRKNGRVQVTLSVLNEGNVLVRPRGQVQVRKGAASVLSQEINAAKTAVLPGEAKDYLLDLPESELTAGPYEAVAEVDFGGNEIVGGRVTLE